LTNTPQYLENDARYYIEPVLFDVPLNTL